ncbi:MAG: phosphonopyruvate decarboxylase [Bacillota bacterium]
MINCRFFYDALVKYEIDFFTGVPDSLLKSINACIAENSPKGRHLVAANEGNAAALAAGHYLSTGKTGLVYMQNSGLGNAINPLVSLADMMVYGIPMLLLIGWRGEPGLPDEPQHIKQGLVTLPLLQALGINYCLLPGTDEDAFEELTRAIEHSKAYNEPYALVAVQDVFAPYEPEQDMEEKPGAQGENKAKSFKNADALQEKQDQAFSDTGNNSKGAANGTGGGAESKPPLSREEAAIIALESMEPDAALVSTTGKLSREIYEYRDRGSAGHEKDFLNVGSMGHASQIALGVALNQPDRDIYCFDGDGAVIMHMGALATCGTSGATNYKHLVFNNSTHDSVGGQPTVAGKIDLVKIAEACGYKKALRAKSKEELTEALEKLKTAEGPAFLEIKVSSGARKDLGRPQTTPWDNKQAFMKFLGAK